MKPFLNIDLNCTFLHIKATPNSSQTKISGKFIDDKNQEYLKINLAASPEDNKANEELISYLSKYLKIPKSKIELIRGEKSRIKIIKISDQINLQI